MDKNENEIILARILFKAMSRRFLSSLNYRLLTFIKKGSGLPFNEGLSNYITSEEKVLVLVIIAQREMFGAVDVLISKVFKFYIEGAQNAGSDIL